ncbi:helix-turn-helix domain-containing protein [Enterobacter bugandensis]|uniref:helix-turn-helix domain-containing protein n=1 Tax=Enterobacter bugandensis TaxID=881260 RepID=UPI0004883609|nr:helix-turn-helix domain-containing protein [Enterobacter bugandensis]MCK6727682.1 helix-turn-helix domain-containing protein [Enterobacter bugandensis]MCK6808517.1 helix-turn-helix domain-containing protein [Enterobacter bugandensis]MCK7195538.1 helix-turn-helix domain-containing protein [Enterobacter bugandensis]MCK7204389.1 helix-turn-helix domain-containing protein [Enterobacter bugandensis]MDK7609680.1 helix-turn-helix domain-containing protein [Enterobacter bugandensis]
MSSTDKSSRGSPYAQELIVHLEPYCTVRRTGRGERLNLEVNGQGLCYLILEGTIAIYRTSDNMMLSTARSPALFGLANLTDIYFNDYLVTVSPCLIGSIPTEQVADIIKEKGLWGLLSRQLMFVYSRLYNNVMPQGAPTAYEMIRQQLIKLMEEDEGYRSSVTAERYIREKTQLSRSGVMRILADLKTGGFIEMEEGRLIKINKLPAKY